VLKVKSNPRRFSIRFLGFIFRDFKNFFISNDGQRLG